MKTLTRLASAVCLLVFLANFSWAVSLFPKQAASKKATVAQGPMSSTPWEKFSISLGAFLSNTESGVRVGSGLGVDVDMEDALGLEKETTALRADTSWRFTQNRRHRLDASWFALHRNASRTVNKDFDIKDQDGNTVTVQAGSELSTKFNLDIIETSYSYSFLQDDRIDLSAGLGVYAMPINFELAAAGLTQVERNFNFTAPLPVLGLRMDVALTPQWFMRTRSQFFYIQYENVTGRLTQLEAAIEFLPVKNIGIGVGLDTMRFALEAEQKTNANSKRTGKLGIEYIGGQIYTKLLF